MATSEPAVDAGLLRLSAMAEDTSMAAMEVGGVAASGGELERD